MIEEVWNERQKKSVHGSAEQGKQPAYAGAAS
jgi:hypothetical protein